MSGDGLVGLTTRLRESADRLEFGMTTPLLLREAADTIERLEAESRRLRSAAGELYEHTKFSVSPVVQSCRTQVNLVLDEMGGW